MTHQQSPVYGICSPARCAACSRVTDYSDVCRWCAELLYLYGWIPQVADGARLEPELASPPLYLQQRQAMAAGNQP